MAAFSGPGKKKNGKNPPLYWEQGAIWDTSPPIVHQFGALVKSSALYGGQQCTRQGIGCQLTWNRDGLLHTYLHSLVHIVVKRFNQGKQLLLDKFQVVPLLFQFVFCRLVSCEQAQQQTDECSQFHPETYFSLYKWLWYHPLVSVIMQLGIKHSTTQLTSCLQCAEPPALLHHHYANTQLPVQTMQHPLTQCSSILVFQCWSGTKACTRTL